jgi:hypothetical protein
MRKHQQGKILELISTLHQMQTEGLYADCQDGAFGIGEYIESIEGEGTQTVTLLEEYCELLFKASNGEVGEKSLKRHLIKVENSVKNELKPNKTEVVFLPYNASMWDSLESIWFAARDDQQCESYVIPIPYYDLKPDRSLGEEHYEGTLYPDYVPVVDWQTYDIEVRHPDVIYIHYPYDDAAQNATIHPNYYSKRLREHCDLLAYVPYFVLPGAEVPDYCSRLPGIIYANRVILQNEEVKKSYIDHYNRFDKEYGWNGQFGKADKKFISLGSPKFDKVINSKREDFRIPEEWEGMLYKADGSKKKIILYNTHMFSWLNGGEQYFEKLASVFCAFRSRDDIVLWWRPHPNTELNFRTMRPQLYDKYRHMVNEYKCEGWGIYDDTPDLHRAIAWTDAYYGDHSSLVVLYQVAGKPVVIQNIYKTEDKIPLWFGEFAIGNDGQVWSFELYRDGLFTLDFEQNTACCATQSDCMPKYMGKKHLYSTHRYIGIHCITNEVLCLPHFLDNILIHNSKNGINEMLRLDTNYLLSPDSDGYALRYAIEYQNKVYCFGQYTKAVIVFSSTEHCVRYDTMLFERIGTLTDTSKSVKYPLYISECSKDGTITALFRNCEHLIRYNLPSQNTEFIISNPIIAKCIYADFDGQSYWLLSENNDELIKWDPDSNEIRKYAMSANGYVFSAAEEMFTGISDCGNFVLIFPGYGNILLRLDKETGRFSEYKKLPMIVNDSIFKYDKPKRVGNKIFAFARFQHKIYEINLETNTITSHSFNWDEDSYKTYLDSFIEIFNNDDIADGAAIGLDEKNLGNTVDFLIGSINSMNQQYKTKQKENFYRHAVNSDGTSGVAIYNYVREGAK